MKIKLNQTLVAVLTSAVLFTSTHANASGIPTVDGAAIAQGVQDMVMDMTNHAETIAQWTQQAQDMYDSLIKLEAQINNQIQHLNAIKGARGLGKVGAVLDIADDAPEEWADIYATIQKIDPTKTLKDIQIDPDSEIKHAEELKNQAIKDGKQLKKVFSELKDIGTRIQNGEVKEPKDAADIQTRIQYNAAIITAMATRYDILEKELQQQERLQEQKQHELDRCGFREERGLKCD